MFQKSFYDWCKDTNHLFFLERWDYKKNYIDPHEISYCDMKTDIYFLCESNKHDSESHRLGNITRHNKIPKCSICCSFGEWCKENKRIDLLNRWDYEKNKITPYEISISSTKKMYFKCPKGIHDSELKDLNNIRKQYKSGICRKCESIGQFLIDKYGNYAINQYWSDKNKCDPFNVSRYSTKKYGLNVRIKNIIQIMTLHQVISLKEEDVLTAMAKKCVLKIRLEVYIHKVLMFGVIKIKLVHMLLCHFQIKKFFGNVIMAYIHLINVVFVIL